MTRVRLLNPHVMAVMENEWAQLVRNRVIVFTTLAPPFLLVALALVVLFLSSLLNNDGFGTVTGGAPMFELRSADGLIPDTNVLQTGLLGPFLVLFLVISVVVPITIASYSIVGEKQNRSLEALLSTPIRTWELMLAKALSAALPGLLATWYSYAVFSLAGYFALSESVYKQLILSPTWLIAILILSPVLTLLAVGLGVIISSRVRDPHSAQQLGSLVVLPLIGVIVAQTVGAVDVSVSLILGTAVVIGLTDIGIMVLAVRTFRRESIVTTWR
jgi:ABC-2 type transport system permease protein